MSSFSRGYCNLQIESRRRSTTLLVEDGKLNGNAREVLEQGRRFRRAILLVLVVEVDQHVPMRAVRREQDEHDEIRDEQRHVEGVGVIKAPESGVEKMLSNVLSDATGRGEGGEEG